MKGTNKFMAIVLTVAMIMSISSITVFAGDVSGTITTLKIGDLVLSESTTPKLSDITGKVVSGANDAAQTAAVLKGATVDVTLAATNLGDGASPAIVATSGSATAVAYRVLTKAQYDTLVSIDTNDIDAVAAAGSALGTAALVNGTYVAIVAPKEDSGPDDAYVILHIKVPSSGTIDGDSTVEEVIFQVTVPANLDFALDPYEISGKGQVVGADYKFTNKTVIPVKIDLSFTATLETGVTLKSSDAEVFPDDNTKTTKDLLLSVVGAGVATDNAFAGLSYAGIEPGTGTPEEKAAAAALELAKRSSVFDTTDKDAAISFALAAGSSGAVVTGTSGITAFTLQGKLNTYADWEDSDVKVTAEYDLNGLRGPTYTADSSGAAKKLVGLNVYETVPAVAPYGFTSGTGLSAINLAPSGPDASFLQTAAFTFDMDDIATAILPFAFNGVGIKDIWCEGTNPVWPIFDATSTFSKVTTGIKFDSSWTTPGVVSMYVTLDNNDGFKVVVTIVN